MGIALRKGHKKHDALVSSHLILAKPTGPGSGDGGQTTSHRGTSASSRFHLLRGRAGLQRMWSKPPHAQTRPPRQIASRNDSLTVTTRRYRYSRKRPRYGKARAKSPFIVSSANSANSPRTAAFILPPILRPSHTRLGSGPRVSTRTGRHLSFLPALEHESETPHTDQQDEQPQGSKCGRPLLTASPTVRNQGARK